MRHHAQQGAILLLSSAAMWVLAMPAPANRWGFVIGLAAQPFWFIATWRARQWGMFANTFIYTAALLVGLRNHWGS